MAITKEQKNMLSRLGLGWMVGEETPKVIHVGPVGRPEVPLTKEEQAYRDERYKKGLRMTAIRRRLEYIDRELYILPDFGCGPRITAEENALKKEKQSLKQELEQLTKELY